MMTRSKTHAEKSVVKCISCEMPLEYEKIYTWSNDPYCLPCYEGRVEESKESMMKEMTAIYVLEDGETWTIKPPVRLLLDAEEYEEVCNDLKPRALENYYERLGGDDDLAGITRRQLTELIDLLPEYMLPCARKILNYADT
jgi:hypothetical protein